MTSESHNGDFLAAVRDVGALGSAGEAERAAKATLSELGGCLSWAAGQNLAAWLPKPLRQLVNGRSFTSSASRFAPKAFVKSVAEHEGVGLERAAHDTRAVLLALDQSLPVFLSEQVHAELTSLWGPLTHQEKSGIVDQAKVTRSALQNAASIAALVLTTEAVITETPPGPKETVQ
jgi:uncharacterized protein (DUF2267 family)